MASNTTLKALGLYTQPNQLETAPGSLVTASNIIIKRDDVIESRRGYKLYGTAMGTSSDRAKQLMTYKDRILRHFSNVLEFDTFQLDALGESIFLAFSGNFLEPQPGRRIRFIEANSNFYFTSSDGIKKISAQTADDFTTAPGYITQAGGIKALDLTARLSTPANLQNGILPQDSAVAYRVVWGYNDANNNLILGTPSQRAEVFNPLISLELQDFMRILGALDNVAEAGGSLISDTDYVSTLELPITASATDLYNNLISLASKIDNDILYADTAGGTPIMIGGAGSAISVTSNIATITRDAAFTQNFSDYLSPGSKIFLSGFVGSAAVANGAQIVATSGTNTITFNLTTPDFSQSPVTTGQIFSNEFRSITQPAAPSIPPTDDELVALQTYMNNIIVQLQSFPTTGTPPVISSASLTAYINNLDITTTANVILNITIPQRATVNTFYQIYRSPVTSATGPLTITDLVPSDEMKLVFEGFPTTTDLSNGFVEVEDDTPDSFAGAFLYTNATTGEGITQANDLPPYALDINKFKNYTFYANTRTLQREQINLLGVTNMITDFNNSIIPTISISDGVTTNTYTFVTGLFEITLITFGASEAAVNTLEQAAVTATFFTLNSANDYRKYYVWFSNGTTLQPTSSDIPDIADRTEIKVLFNNADTNSQVAAKARDAIAVENLDFVTATASSPNSHELTIENTEVGYTTDSYSGGTGLTDVVIQQGRGENAATNQILLSTLTSPAQAVDQTARSLVRVINKNVNEVVYAYYLSGAQDVPGKVLLEGRALTDVKFYILGNNSNTGLSFNPDLSPATFISSIATGFPSLITTSTPHGLINLDQVMITDTDSTPSTNGLYTITYVSSTQFTINVNVTVAGTRGSIRSAATAISSNNEPQRHRIYYSKLLQPEAVPLVNFIDVGAQDKAILRIFPLRDSLFVFKEDGLFRISGETAPFNLALFDSSVILLAADSLDVSNNTLYGWTTQGISTITEGGASIASRAIDIDILKLATAQYVNFKTATWGIGYESDNSYTVYTTANQTDQVATIGYRFSTLTNSWTTFDKSCTCGIIDSADDKQYLGAGDVNFIEQERKNFSRTDYADREYVKQLIGGNYYGFQLKLPDLEHIEEGDVFTQEQLLTIYQYNTTLQKLDIDPLLSPHDYVSTLTAVGGDDLRVITDALINKVAFDPGRISQPGFTPSADYTVYESINTVGTITNISAGEPAIVTSPAHGLQTGRVITIAGTNSTPSADGTYVVTVLTANTFTIPKAIRAPSTTGTFSVENNDFRDVEASFNGMIALLNNDNGVAFGNYQPVNTTTLQEANVIAVDSVSKKVTLDLKLDFVVGPLTLYKAIQSDVQWSPYTMGDVLNFKHIREATLMFENRAFKEATLSFSSDLVPQFFSIPFNGTGKGLFGFDKFGNNYFGGASNSPPFRTYIPRQTQRCRFLNIKFTHKAARELYAIFGLTLTGEITPSSRAYRS